MAHDLFAIAKVLVNSTTKSASLNLFWASLNKTVFNVTLLAFAAERRCCWVPGGRRCRSISPARTALGRKPAAVDWWDGRTDDQPFHLPCSADRIPCEQCSHTIHPVFSHPVFCYFSFSAVENMSTLWLLPDLLKIYRVQVRYKCVAVAVTVTLFCLSLFAVKQFPPMVFCKILRECRPINLQVCTPIRPNSLYTLLHFRLEIR